MCDLLKAVNRYLVREFDSDSALEKIPEDGIFHLAYTTYEFGDDKEHEIQVDFDLLNLKYLNYIDGVLVLEEEVQPEPEEKPAEENKDEISKDAKKRALEAACINMGIDTSAPQNVQVTMEEGQLVVRFDFGEGVTYVTTVDPNSFEATSSYSI